MFSSLYSYSPAFDAFQKDPTVKSQSSLVSLWSVADNYTIVRILFWSPFIVPSTIKEKAYIKAYTKVAYIKASSELRGADVRIYSNLFRISPMIHWFFRVPYTKM